MGGIDRDAGTASTVTHGRVGVAMLVQHHVARRGSDEVHPLPEPMIVHRSIHQALKDDARVGHLADFPPDTSYSNLTFAVAQPGKAREGQPPLGPLGHMHVLTFGEPLVFSVRSLSVFSPLSGVSARSRRKSIGPRGTESNSSWPGTQTPAPTQTATTADSRYSTSFTMLSSPWTCVSGFSRADQTVTTRSLMPT